MSASYVPNLSVSNSDALYVGRAFTFPSGNSTPFCLPTQNQRVFRVFIGPNITPQMQVNLQRVLNHRFQAGQTTYQGLAFTISQQAWTSSQNARAVLSFFDRNQHLLEYSLVQVIDSQCNIELHCGYNAEQGSRAPSSYVYAPIDAFGELDKVARMLVFPSLAELEVVSPAHPLDNPEQLNTAVQGIMQVLRGAQRTLRKCTLSLDLTILYLPSLCETFGSSTVSELVLVPPVHHDLGTFLTIGAAHLSLEQSIQFLQGIHTLTLPIALITPGSVHELSQLPNLEHLIVIPCPDIDSICRFHQCLQDSLGITIRGVPVGPFHRLISLDLGPLGHLDQRVFNLRMILPYAALVGDYRQFPDLFTNL